MADTPIWLTLTTLFFGIGGPVATVYGVRYATRSKEKTDDKTLIENKEKSFHEQVLTRLRDAEAKAEKADNKIEKLEGKVQEWQEKWTALREQRIEDLALIEQNKLIIANLQTDLSRLTDSQKLTQQTYEANVTRLQNELVDAKHREELLNRHLREVQAELSMCQSLLESKGINIPMGSTESAGTNPNC